jgi:mannose-6-phosphate isomerase-like protein (cupin superfamily)
VARWTDAAAALENALASDSWEGEVRIAPVCDDLTFARHHALAIHLLDIAVHGWDLARALGIDDEPGTATVEAVRGVADLIATRPVPSTREQFAAPLHTRDDEPRGWERVLRRLGRDPGWQPPVTGGALPALEAVGLGERLARFTETWSPKIVCRVNDHEVKVVKLLGEFTWHTHTDTDELFAVVTGRMRIEMRHGSVDLGPGDLYVVPRGVEHRPVAEVPTEAVLLEPAGVVNTGDAGGPLTAVDEALV